MKEDSDYQLSSTLHEGLLEIVISGNLTGAAVAALHNQVIALIQTNHARAVLCDVRDAKGPTEFGEAYYRVRRYPRDLFKLPLAIVEPPTHVAYQSFHETTAANAGLSLKWFSDIDEARAWIKMKLESVS